MPPPIIVYEGVEDRAFLEALLSNRRIGPFDFHNHCAGNGGFENTLRALRVINGIENRESIIIVADNDGNPSGQFQSIQRQIISAGFIAPSQPRQETLQTGFPPIIVLMLPWDNDPGCLETVCLISAQNAYERQLQCVDQLSECVGVNGWSVPARAKLRMRCYLSSVCQSDPNTGLRYAWSRTENPIPISDACFNQIADYLASLA